MNLDQKNVYHELTPHTDARRFYKSATEQERDMQMAYKQKVYNRWSRLSAHVDHTRGPEPTQVPPMNPWAHEWTNIAGEPEPSEAPRDPVEALIQESQRCPTSSRGTWGSEGTWDTEWIDESYLTPVHIPEVEHVPEVDVPQVSEEQTDLPDNSGMDYPDTPSDSSDASDSSSDSESDGVPEGHPLWVDYNSEETDSEDEADEADEDPGTSVSNEGWHDAEEEDTDERMRQDDTDGEWYTKDQFFEYYGSDRIWDAMHPEKQMKRCMIERIFKSYGHLSKVKLELFLDEMLDTY
jgi:hypothetical protein